LQSKNQTDILTKHHPALFWLGTALILVGGAAIYGAVQESLNELWRHVFVSLLMGALSGYLAGIQLKSYWMGLFVAVFISLVFAFGLRNERPSEISVEVSSLPAMGRVECTA